MESIKQIYRIGHGPSSSHTMGPMRAAQMFVERNRGAVRFNVTLYGSLAATGKGHMTDAAILEVLQPVAKTTITWEPKIFLPFHPNGMLFESFNEKNWNRGLCTVLAAVRLPTKVLTNLKRHRSMR